MKKLFRISLLIFLFSWLGCGAGAPPASIPAPVSSLMSVSPPDGSGAVTIAGDPGAALPGATVTGTNLTATGAVFKWQPLFLKVAHAQIAGQFQDTTVADNLGAFVLRLDAQSGDVLGIHQELNGEFSDITQLDVP